MHSFIKSKLNFRQIIFFNNIDKYLSKKDFAIIGCSVKNASPYIPGGFFDKKKSLINKNNLLKMKVKKFNESRLGHW